MKGLIIKDLLNLKKNLYSVLGLVIFLSFIGFSNNEPSVLISMITMVFTILTITTIAYDDLARWDKYALAMPVSRRSIVLSKYIISALLSVFGVLLSTISAFIISMFKVYDLTNLILISYIIFIISLAFISFLLPLVFKFGVEKSRLMMMGIIGVPMAIGYMLDNMGIKLPSEDFFNNILKLSPLIILVILAISYSISYGIYKKKDM